MCSSVSILLPAIKLLTKAVKKLSMEELEAASTSIVVGLFKVPAQFMSYATCYMMTGLSPRCCGSAQGCGLRTGRDTLDCSTSDRTASQVRMRCHNWLPFTPCSTLSGSQLKLLQIYIKKAEVRLKLLLLISFTWGLGAACQWHQGRVNAVAGSSMRRQCKW